MKDTWLSDQAACSQLGHDITENIDKRNHEHGETSVHMKLSSNIRSSMSTFSQAVNQLRDDLIATASRRRLTQREVERRQVLMDQLATQEHRLEAAMRGGRGGQSDRSALMSASTNPFHSDDPWDATPASTNPFHTPNSSHAFHEDDGDAASAGLAQIRQQQQHIMREQDAGLDSLSSVLSRQKQMALDIGNEVTDHNVLIDDIRDQTDHTNQRISQETRHVRIVDRKSNTCWMWVIIVLLVIAIVVVAVVPNH